MPDRWTGLQMLELAARGLGKVDVLGARGTTLCSMDEIAAMAAVLALCGLPAIRPGEAAPETPAEAFRDILTILNGGKT